MPKIKLGDQHLFFDVYGSQLKIGATSVEQKPTLLVLHGGHGMVDHTLYVDFWSKFAGVAQVIFLDQRGCGRSDPCGPEQWNLRTWADDVVAFCEALSIEKPIVAGVSMGGHVICDYATRFPGHPEALIFCNTEAQFNVDMVCACFEKLGGKEIADIARANFTNSTPEIVKLYKEKCVPYYAKKAYSAKEIERCVQRMEIFEFFCKQEMQHFNYLAELHKITAPSLFMVSEESPGHPPAAAEAMVEKMNPDLVAYHLFKGAGAPTYNDAPEESYQVVLEFLRNQARS